MNAADFQAWSDAVLNRVESALSDWVPAAAPAGLGEAMRYGVLDGGKRLRALLVQAAAEAGADIVAELTADVVGGLGHKLAGTVSARLGVGVFAESVETQEEKHMLESLFIDGNQGYYVGKPAAL